MISDLIIRSSSVRELDPHSCAGDRMLYDVPPCELDAIIRGTIRFGQKLRKAIWMMSLGNAGYASKAASITAFQRGRSVWITCAYTRKQTSGECPSRAATSTTGTPAFNQSDAAK